MLILKLSEVREYSEGHTLELRRRPEDSRLVVRAYNEGGYNFVEIDLLDMVEWTISRTVAFLNHIERR